MSFKAIFYDTETTGVKADKDRIIELAAYDPQNECTFCTFIDPQCPVPSDATLISGITDEMVKGAPLAVEALQKFVDFCSPDAILIAHNNETFDKVFLTTEFQRAQLAMPSWRFFDTLKWSRKYRSDLPRHSLQFLREVYGVASNQAHRALDDVKVLYQVFSRMVDDLSWETILLLMQQKSQIARMPFGKYAGKLLNEVPKDYIAWLKSSGALDKKENEQLKEEIAKLLGTS